MYSNNENDLFRNNTSNSNDLANLEYFSRQPSQNEQNEIYHQISSGFGNNNIDMIPLNKSNSTPGEKNNNNNLLYEEEIIDTSLKNLENQKEQEQEQENNNGNENLNNNINNNIFNNINYPESQSVRGSEEMNINYVVSNTQNEVKHMYSNYMFENIIKYFNLNFPNVNLKLNFLFF